MPGNLIQGITKDSQEAILKQLNKIADETEASEREFQFLLAGAVVALGKGAPPYWVLNATCGRADRLRIKLP